MRQLLAILGAAAVVALVAAGLAGALSGSVPAPPANPTSADQIQNIDQVKTAIKGYYGDTVTNQMDPVNGTVQLHTFDPDGSYAHEMADLETRALRYLSMAASDHRWTDTHGQPHGHAPTGQRAVLFDIDDTTLNTYNYEIYSNFVYNPTSNAAFVNSAAFPAVPGMVEVEHAAESKGYTIFFLTGRPVSQHDGTVANLTDVGYDVTDANLYLKDLTRPIYDSCAPSCTTTQYKSLTRQYIESQGYDIVANFGDQYSDLEGGFADQTFKVPNPMYYLP